MTVSNHRKALKQLKSKPKVAEKFLKFCAPKKRKTGRSRKRCRLCGRVGGHIDKYGLNLCRQCFRENATKLGFKKFN